MRCRSGLRTGCSGLRTRLRSCSGLRSGLQTLLPAENLPAQDLPSEALLQADLPAQALLPLRSLRSGLCSRLRPGLRSGLLSFSTAQKIKTPWQVAPSKVFFYGLIEKFQTCQGTGFPTDSRFNNIPDLRPRIATNRKTPDASNLFAAEERADFGSFGAGQSEKSDRSEPGEQDVREIMRLFVF